MHLIPHTKQGVQGQVGNIGVTICNRHLLSLLKPYPSEEMKAYAVSSLINSPLNNVPEVINSLQKPQKMMEQRQE